MKLIAQLFSKSGLVESGLLNAGTFPMCRDGGCQRPDGEDHCFECPSQVIAEIKELVVPFDGEVRRVCFTAAGVSGYDNMVFLEVGQGWHYSQQVGKQKTKSWVPEWNWVRAGDVLKVGVSGQFEDPVVEVIIGMKEV